MASITADTVSFKSQKTIMLTLNNVTEQKAINMLMYIHA